MTPTKKQQRVALYARVSTLQDQDPEVQLRELRAYARDRGFKIVGTFTDRASGAKDERPQLTKLWEVVRGRKVDIVIVWKFDRFARSTKQLIDALEEFQHLGINFISMTEQIDTSSPAGKALYTMVSVFAEFERSLISERVKSGLAKARATGATLGRPAHAEDAVAQVKKLRKKGLSYSAISKQTGIPRSSVIRFVQHV